MTMAIQQRVSKLNGLQALYGMGSFFRGESYSDIDFVAVVDCQRDALVELGQQIRGAVHEECAALGAATDVIVFTAEEFHSKPLRDMSSLVQVYSKH